MGRSNDLQRVVRARLAELRAQGWSVKALAERAVPPLPNPEYLSKVARGSIARPELVAGLATALALPEADIRAAMDRPLQRDDGAGRAFSIEELAPELPPGDLAAIRAQLARIRRQIEAIERAIGDADEGQSR